MKRLLSIFVAVVLLTAFGMLALAKPTNAQGANGFVISPVRQELTIEKGKSQTVTLYIANATKLSATVRVIVNDFEANDEENGQPRILLDEDASATGNSFKSLVGDLPDIELGPEGKAELPVTLSVPANAQAGGYYGLIRVVSKDNTNDKNVGLSASVGTTFLVKVPGELTEKLELVEFTAAKNGSTGRFFINSGEIKLMTRLRNTGNIHVKPFGKVTITNNSGKVVETYEFNNVDPRANILPNSIRKFEDKLKNQKWLGKYTISANLGYGTAGSLITAKNTFWVVPTWVIIVGVILILAILLGLYIVYRKFTSGRKHHRSTRR